MKGNFGSIIITVAFLVFMSATFINGYESYFITRIIAVLFGCGYLIIELKKEYFASRKTAFCLFGVISIAAIGIGIFMDTQFLNTPLNGRIVLAPIFAFILLALLYQDLFDENKRADTSQ